MKEKCTKFEGMFIFSNDEDFKNHLQECEECRKKQEELNQISALIKKAKPFYFEQKTKKNRQLRVALGLLLFISIGSVFEILNYMDTPNETASYTETLSAEDFGFPVDSYGLIMVDE